MPEKQLIIQILKERVKYYRSCASNAGDYSDLIELGGKISKIELVIDILEAENWEDDDWQEWVAGLNEE